MFSYKLDYEEGQIRLHFEFQCGDNKFKQHLTIDEPHKFFADIDEQIKIFELNNTFEFTPAVSNGEIYLIFNARTLSFGIGSYGDDKGYHGSDLQLGILPDVSDVLMHMLLKIRKYLFEVI